MKATLESTFDLPFCVKRESGDYIIYPSNDMEELFVLHIHNRSNIRLIIEVAPQRHAAAMLRDMSTADDNKIRRFRGYYDLIRSKNAKISATVNGVETDFSAWTRDWKTLSIRVSKIEEFAEGFEEIAKRWAKLMCGMMLSLLNVEQIETPGYAEGKKIEVKMTKYERNPINRELCLEYNGTKCKICGFDFEKVYGEIGKGFIHVHHIIPVSQVGGDYIPDPQNDLIPVCPNCHAMLHTSNPPLMPEELISKMNFGDDSCEE